MDCLQLIVVVVVGSVGLSASKWKEPIGRAKICFGVSESQPQIQIWNFSLSISLILLFPFSYQTKDPFLNSQRNLHPIYYSSFLIYFLPPSFIIYFLIICSIYCHFSVVYFRGERRRIAVSVSVSVSVWGSILLHPL